MVEFGKNFSDYSLKNSDNVPLKFPQNSKLYKNMLYFPRFRKHSSFYQP